MKRISVIILLPLVMFALERVNLIKDHSFEKDGEVWNAYTIGADFPDPTEAIVNTNDSSNSILGKYSGSADTRPIPSDHNSEDVYIKQGFSVPKTLQDIDSLLVSYSTYCIKGDNLLCWFAFILLHLDANKATQWKVGYALRPPDLAGTPLLPHVYLQQIIFPSDSAWYGLEKNIYKDIEEWVQNSIPLDATLDSLILRSRGVWMPPWRGQKVFFDDIRLMGYADYDVGIKDILSGDGGSPYTPEARIKNFGREPADSFLVIAEISKEETTHYADTMPWSLPADTEDTVSFSEFIPLDTGIHTLRIYTVMEPDESDADDELSKELDFTAIAEPPIPITHLNLDVEALSVSGVLHVSYALPESYSGTLTLFDLSGRRIESKQVRGYGSAKFSNPVASGIYLVRLEASGLTISRKVVVVE